MNRTHANSIRVGSIMENHKLTVSNFKELKNYQLKQAIREAIAEAYNWDHKK